MKLTRQQIVHTAIHSGKYPVGVMLGAVVGGYSGFLVALTVAMVGYSFEIVSDLLYWHAINLRPRSSVALQNIERNFGDHCTNCGHDIGDHTVTTEYLVECLTCGCVYRE